MTDVANTEELLRIIQSIPSPKAEPFKMWFARVGSERIDENREVAIKGGSIAGNARKEIESTTGNLFLHQKVLLILLKL